MQRILVGFAFTALLGAGAIAEPPTSLPSQNKPLHHSHPLLPGGPTPRAMPDHPQQNIAKKQEPCGLCDVIQNVRDTPYAKAKRDAERVAAERRAAYERRLKDPKAKSKHTAKEDYAGIDVGPLSKKTKVKGTESLSTPLLKTTQEESRPPQD
jgi:hypothetical protein